MHPSALAPKRPCRIAARAAGARCWGTNGAGPTYACYQLYAAHRRSHEICKFAGTIPAINNAGDLDDLADLLRLHTGLEGLVREIGYANDDSRPAVAGRVGHLRTMLASFAAQWFGRGALVGR
jgi:hypothetical protein